MEEPFAADALVSNYQQENQLEDMEVVRGKIEVGKEAVAAAAVDAKIVATNAETEDISHAIADVEDVAGNCHRLFYLLQR